MAVTAKRRTSAIKFWRTYEAAASCEDWRLGIRSIKNWLSPRDPELVKKTLIWIDEQNGWNDVFSTKLIELLDKIDKIKHEIRENLRSADNAQQLATSALADAQKQMEAAKTALDDAQAVANSARVAAEDANQKLQSAREVQKDVALQLRRALQRFTLVAMLPWVAMAWVAWSIVQRNGILWGAIGLSMLASAIAVAAIRGARSDK